MDYFICEKQGRCCPHEFYNSIEQAISDSEDGVPCDHLIEVDHVRHGRWCVDGVYVVCSVCNRFTLSPIVKQIPTFKYCPNCGAKMDEEMSE